MNRLGIDLVAIVRLKHRPSDDVVVCRLGNQVDVFDIVSATRFSVPDDQCEVRFVAPLIPRRVDAGILVAQGVGEVEVWDTVTR